MRRNRTVYVRAFSALIAAALFTSCQEESITVQQQAHTVGFYAGGGQTRTTMLSDGLSTAWEEGDEVSLWARNSSGSYTLSNQIFQTYGLDSGWASFKSTIDPMADDTYTYLCCYPVPLSINVTEVKAEVTFNLPSVQDGKVGGGADIMLARPVSYGPLRDIPDPDDLSGLRVSMKHMLHQFRFFIPGDNEVIGDEKLERILLTFPTGVVGNVTCDLEDPDASPELVSSPSNVVELKLTDPLGISNPEIQYACFAFVPQTFVKGQKMTVKAYTSDRIADIEEVDLCPKTIESGTLESRTFESGHSTPVKLNVTKLKEFAGIITFNLTENNVGENPTSIKITAPAGCILGDGGSREFVYSPGREIKVGEKIEFKFETDTTSYTKLSEKEITITYDSENTITTQKLTMPSIPGPGKTSVDMTIPYLLYEDFSSLKSDGESYGNNTYDGEDRHQPGNSLDEIMPVNGWNAARFWVKTDGGSFRLNVRWQMVKIIISFTSTHYGRLDTPPLSGIKPGKNVKVRVAFDAGANVHTSSNDNAESGNMTRISFATHTNSSNPIDGVGIGTGQDGDLADFGETVYNSQFMPNAFGPEDFGNKFPNHVVEGVEATNATRLCFYPSTAFTASGITNAEFNVYIDNIKVQIAK